MSIRVNISLSKIMHMPIKVDVRTYATYAIVEPSYFVKRSFWNRVVHFFFKN